MLPLVEFSDALLAYETNMVSYQLYKEHSTEYLLKDLENIKHVCIIAILSFVWVPSILRTSCRVLQPGFLQICSHYNLLTQFILHESQVAKPKNILGRELSHHSSLQERQASSWHTPQPSSALLSLIQDSAHLSVVVRVYIFVAVGGGGRNLLTFLTIFTWVLGGLASLQRHSAGFLQFNLEAKFSFVWETSDLKPLG